MQFHERKVLGNHDGYGMQYNKNGEINPSIYKIREELVKRKKKKDNYGKISSLGLLVGSLPLLGFFFIGDSDFTGILGYLTSPWVMLGILLILFSYACHQIYYQKEKDKFDALKAELIGMIWNDFCSCWSACSHKEDFLRETDEKYGINLYWK